MHKSLTKEKDNSESTNRFWQKRKAFAKSVIVTALILVVVVSGCTNNTNTNSNVIEDCVDSTTCELPLDKQLQTPKTSDIEKIEVYHFHGTNQCYSCKTVGAYAEETLKTFFADELESGKIIFDHINYDLPENQELVEKYEVTGSSLWIGTYSAGKKFHKEQNTNVWYKIGNKQEYQDYLKGVIEKKLSGDLN